jgi:hypothetical protein
MTSFAFGSLRASLAGTCSPAENYLGLTSSAVFRDNVLFWLLEQPRFRR